MNSPLRNQEAGVAAGASPASTKGEDAPETSRIEPEQRAYDGPRIFSCRVLG
jgi:hypothetical protein